MPEQFADSRADPDSLLITVKEVGTILGISSRTVWRLLIEGKMIEPVRLGGNVRWRKEQLLRWIDEGCPPPAVRPSDEKSDRQGNRRGR